MAGATMANLAVKSGWRLSEAVCCDHDRDRSSVSTEGDVAEGRGIDRRSSGHGMLNADRIASRWCVALRHVLMVLINKLPGTRFKTALIRCIFRMEIGEDVGIAYGVYLDPYAPSLITIGKNVIIGFESRIFVHAFTLNRQRVRPVTIGSNVMIGGFCVIAPGVTIGDGASIAPGTIVGRNVPPNAIVIGNSMRIRKRVPCSR